MSCALTSGFTLDCRESMGGIKEVYLIPLNDVNSYATASGVVTGITKASGKRFYKFQQLQQTATATDTPTGSDENGTIFYAQSVTLFFPKMQASTRNLVKVLGANRCIAVTIDRNGVAMMYGAELGLSTNTGEGGPGTAYGDRNGYSVTLSGAEREPAFEVNAATVAALETPGS